MSKLAYSIPSSSSLGMTLIFMQYAHSYVRISNKWMVPVLAQLSILSTVFSDGKTTFSIPLAASHYL